jgi:hypothetical protein
LRTPRFVGNWKRAEGDLRGGNGLVGIPGKKRELGGDIYRFSAGSVVEYPTLKGDRR